MNLKVNAIAVKLTTFPLLIIKNPFFTGLLLFGLSVLGERNSSIIHTNSGVPTTSIEVLMALLIAFLCWKKKLPTLIITAFISIAAGDAMYGITNYGLKLNAPNTPLCLTYVIPYVAAMTFLTISMTKKLLEARQIDRHLDKALFLALIFTVSITTYTITIPALFYKTPSLSAGLAVLTVIFGTLEALLTALILILMVGIAATAVQLGLLGLLIMHLSDLALRYQSVNKELLGMSFFENGWCLGIAIILIALIRLKSVIANDFKWTPIYSLRGMITGLTFISLLAFSIVFAALFHIDVQASIVSAVLLLITAIFAVSIFVSNVVIANISRLNKFVASDLIDQNLQTKNLPYEIKNLTLHYQRLLATVEQERKESLNLAAHVVHDLGTPISVLRILPPMFSSATKGCSKCSVGLADPLEALSIASGAVQKISADLLTHRKQAQDVTTVKAATMNAIHLIRKSNLKCNLATEIKTEEQGPIVTGLTRVITNLIKNAIEATEMSDAPISVRLVQNDHTFILTIKDHGKGIPKHILTKIQANEIATTKINGNGLGLSGMIAWSVKNSSKYSIESEEKIGTTISINIPIAQA